MTRRILAAMLLVAAASAQTPAALERGQVIGRVVTLANPAQSYALYLPKAYDPAKSWPIIIAFDPGAIGQRPVTLAKEAAEEFGYIVVASNNSQNGSPEPEMEAADAVWTDVHRRFSIDPRRTYFAGFSGGSRLAVQLTASCHGCAAGVIASGAAFPVNREPSASAPFLYFGSYGREDFNYSEYIDIEPKLKKANFSYRLRSFAGGHEWLPTDVWHDALAWFNLQAMKSGALLKDQTFIANALSRGLANAAAQPDDLERLRAYLQIVRDFTGLADVSATQKLAADLAESKTVRDLQRREQQDIRDQDALATPITAKLDDLWIPDRRADARVEIARLFTEIDKRAHSKDPRQQLVAKRARSQAFVVIYEEAMNKVAAKQYPDSLVLLDLIVEAAGRAPGTHVQKSRVYMLMGNKGKALSEARLALKEGLTDADMFSAPEFSELRSTEEFKALFASKHGE